MTELLTPEDLRKALPIKLAPAQVQQLTDHLNGVTGDPLVAEAVRNNFVSYMSVLQDGRYKIQDYLNAVTFVSHKLMNKSNDEAYRATHPDRYQRLLDRGASPKDIAAYVAVYARGELVNKVLRQAMTPFWVLNQDVYQRAINTQADLMMNAQSEKVRVDAANSLLTHLKPPEPKEVNVNIGAQKESGMAVMLENLAKIAEQAHQAITGGAMTTRELAQTKLLEGEAEVLNDG